MFKRVVIKPSQLNVKCPSCEGVGMCNRTSKINKRNSVWKCKNCNTDFIVITSKLKSKPEKVE